MLLHTINKSPLVNNALSACLRMAKDGSGILFIEDGVYGALTGTEITAAVEEAMKTKKVYALEPDVKARGVQDRVIKGVQLVDYCGFVDLTTEYDKVESWL